MGSGRRRSLLPPPPPPLLLLLLLLPAAWGDCGPLPDINHAEPPQDTKHLESFSVGSKVTYRCAAGYIKRPLLSDTIQCLANSQWSNLTEFCGRTCLSPPRVVFARISEEDETQNFYTIGVTVRYICRRGFENITDQLPTSTCRDNLTWSEVPELCQRKSCGIPANPEHGKVITNDYLFGAKADVVCNRGYALKGASRLVWCSLRGSEVAWSQIPACQAISCPPPPAIPDGKHTGNGTREFVYDSVVTYTCDPGLQLVGNETLRCTTENSLVGVWSGPPPECRVSTTAATNQTEPLEDNAAENPKWLARILIPICIGLLVLGILVVIIRKWKDNKTHSFNVSLQKHKTKGRDLPMHPKIAGDEKQPVPWHSYFCHTTSCHVCPGCEEGLHAALAPRAEPAPRGCATCEEWLRAQPHAPRSYSVSSIGSGESRSPAGTSSPTQTADVLRGEGAAEAVPERSDAEQPMDRESNRHVCPVCEDWLRAHLGPRGGGPAAPGERPGGPRRQDEGDTARCPVCPLAGEGTPAHLIPRRTPGCHLCPVCAAPTHAHLCQPRRQAHDG
ncbi:uncharacterized protein LOC141733535 isoform X2 [Larus michahellis]|uniref:uncharacterized protein LOC141733535 isoform X2 n=1 Tax=Larus michahellis TaxID=119627 RepID=UPI003D9BE305